MQCLPNGGNRKPSPSRNKTNDILADIFALIKNNHEYEQGTNSSYLGNGPSSPLVLSTTEREALSRRDNRALASSAPVIVLVDLLEELKAVSGGGTYEQYARRVIKHVIEKYQGTQVRLILMCLDVFEEKSELRQWTAERDGAAQKSGVGTVASQNAWGRLQQSKDAVPSNFAMRASSQRQRMLPIISDEIIEQMDKATGEWRPKILLGNNCALGFIGGKANESVYVLGPRTVQISSNVSVRKKELA